MRNYILLGIAVVAAVLAFFLTKHNLEQEYQRLQLRAAKVEIISPKVDLLQGDVLTWDVLGKKSIFKSHYTGQQIRPEDAKLIIGQKLASDVNKFDYLMWRDIDMPELGRGSTLARRIKSKERALSIAVDHISSVSGLLRPNDHVDILGTFRFPEIQGSSSLDTVTMTILQNVTVLAIGQQMAGGVSAASGARAARGQSYSTVTLNVSPQEAELLVFAQDKGELTLTLRNPNDVYVDTTPQSVNFDFLKQQLDSITQERLERMKSGN